MSATAETIWQVPAYLPYIQPALTPHAIAEVEAKIGHRLPSAYLDLLGEQNGGYIRYSLPELVHDTIAGIGPYFPTLTIFEADSTPDFLSFSLHGLVGFDGDGHWFLCFDYRGHADTPEITYIDVESDHQEIIADSFADYLKKLRVDSENLFVVESANDVERLKTELSSALSVKFETLDDYDYGYVWHRALIGSRSNPSWLWLSPNTVPRGFVRTDDDRYEELREKMSGSAVRYPEYPANAYIIHASDEKSATKLVKNCEETGIPILAMTERLKHA